MLEYIKFPKIVLKEDYELNKTEYLEYKIVNKSRNYLFLLTEEDINSADSFWTITDIKKTISKKQPKHIFIFLDFIDDKIELIVGFSDESNNMNFMYKNSYSLKEVEQISKEMDIKIKLINNFFETNENILIYMANENISKYLSAILKNKYKYHVKSIDKLLNETKMYSKFIKKAKPYLIVIVIGILLNLLGSHFISLYTLNITKKNKKLEQELKQELNRYRSDNKKLKAEIDNVSENAKNVIKVQKNIYYGKGE